MLNIQIMHSKLAVCGFFICKGRQRLLGVSIGRLLAGVFFTHQGEALCAPLCRQPEERDLRLFHHSATSPLPTGRGGGETELEVKTKNPK